MNRKAKYQYTAKTVHPDECKKTPEVCIFDTNLRNSILPCIIV